MQISQARLEAFFFWRRGLLRTDSPRAKIAYARGVLDLPILMHSRLWTSIGQVHLGLDPVCLGLTYLFGISTSNQPSTNRTFIMPTPRRVLFKKGRRGKRMKKKHKNGKQTKMKTDKDKWVHFFVRLICHVEGHSTMLAVSCSFGRKLVNQTK